MRCSIQTYPLCLAPRAKPPARGRRRCGPGCSKWCAPSLSRCGPICLSRTWKTRGAALQMTNKGILSWGITAHRHKQCGKRDSPSGHFLALKLSARNPHIPRYGFSTSFYHLPPIAFNIWIAQCGLFLFSLIERLSFWGWHFNLIACQETFKIKFACFDLKLWEIYRGVKKIRWLICQGRIARYAFALKNKCIFKNFGLNCVN